MRKMTRKCRVLREKKMDYATDHLRHMVSWKSPGEFFGFSRYSTGDFVEETINLKTENGTERKNVRKVRLIYLGHILIGGRVLNSDGQSSKLLIEHGSDTNGEKITLDDAVNLVITKNMLSSNHRVFRDEGTTFFLEERGEKVGPGLYFYTGFYSSVKFGTHSPLLNLNVIPKAFYAPIPVNECYCPESGADIRNLNVEVLYEPSKIRAIRSIGGLPPSSQISEHNRSSGRPQTVLDHLKTGVIDESLLERIARSTKTCVNIGTAASPEWYPMEALQMVPYQSPEKLLVEAGRKLSDISAQRPHESVKKITGEVIPSFLGIGKNNTDGSVLS